MGAPVADRRSQNHATLTSLVYVQLFAAGRLSGRPLRWPRLGPVVRRYASPYRGGGLKGRRGWFVVGALIGRAGRRSRNHVTLTSLVYGRLVTAGRLSGRPLRTRPRAVDYLLSPGCDFVGDAQRASRYALRVSRSVVVGLSLSRRNAASESEINAVRRSQAAVRKTMPH